MSTFLIGLLGAVVSANPPEAMSNLVQQTTNLAIHLNATNSPADLELKAIEADDDAALEEIDQWILENQKFAAEGVGIPNAELNARIRKRLESVRSKYEDFLRRHPGHADGRIAYASFLGDIGEESDAITHLEKARELAPANPAVWNNLANHYGHSGGITNAFTHYEKAISLNPSEPVYYHNFGTTVFLFRKDAREFYKIDEQQVFDKALSLYSNSMRLDPTNFTLASDVAQTYYGIRPLRTNDTLQAWTNALKLASDDIDKQGVEIHLARVKILTGRYDEARAHLDSVTNPQYEELKKRLVRNLTEREKESEGLVEPASTNQPPNKP